MANHAVNACNGVQLDSVNSVFAIVHGFLQVNWSAAWSHSCVDEAPHMWRGVVHAESGTATECNHRLSSLLYEVTPSCTEIFGEERQFSHKVQNPQLSHAFNFNTCGRWHQGRKQLSAG
jgi:hypothetical protein